MLPAPYGIAPIDHYLMPLLIRPWRTLHLVLHEIWNDAEFRVLFALVAIILIVGATFYHLVEGWGWIDSLYFSVTTLATVGFGDFSPQTPWGRLFTIVYIFTGMGLILAFVNAVAHHARQLPAPARSRLGGSKKRG